jgi:thioesterase domain-containing protein
MDVIAPHKHEDSGDMSRSSLPIIFLPGTGGEIPGFDGFNDGCDNFEFEPLSYPGWEQSGSKSSMIEALIADLQAQIVSRVPDGPIRIVGYSVGGHFGYATAIRLQASGRDVVGFCAIDSFMIESHEPSADWKSRAFSEAVEILRKGRIREVAGFMRSKFWRGVFRLAGSRLGSLIQGLSSSRLLSLCALDPIFEKELNLRLLVQAVVPWMASLDREPVELVAPASLLRTSLTAHDDAAWRRRCPGIEIFEIRGQHQTLFDASNIGALREAFLTATRHWR